MDELNKMTYLDYVTRESLRLHSPVPNTVRAPTKDAVIPLSEPLIDRHGVKRHVVRQVIPHCRAALHSNPDKKWRAFIKSVREGDMILIPILAIHRLKSLWGEDADEFK